MIQSIILDCFQKILRKYEKLACQHSHQDRQSISGQEYASLVQTAGAHQADGAGGQMKIYIGNVGALRQLEIMKKMGYGNVLLAPSLRTPKKGIDWILDNGAYSCWVNKKPFDSKKFEESLIKIQKFKSNPDFIIVPDIVAAGMDSLYFSLSWIHKIPAGYKAYLAVQDGMTTNNIWDYLDWFDGIFVGGSLDWKLKTAKNWIDLAHSQNMKCHIGRVGTFKRLVWAKNIGADSVDSSTFAQARKGTGFKRIKEAELQTTLY